MGGTGDLRLRRLRPPGGGLHASSSQDVPPRSACIACRAALVTRAFRLRVEHAGFPALKERQPQKGEGSLLFNSHPNACNRLERRCCRLPKWNAVPCRARTATPKTCAPRSLFWFVLGSTFPWTGCDKKLRLCQDVSRGRKKGKVTGSAFPSCDERRARLC